MYVHTCARMCGVCGFYFLLHVHSLYDTTMTRLSRLEKGGGALARRRRPNSYSMFARRRFLLSLALLFSVSAFPLLFEGSTERSSSRTRATTVRSSFSGAEPGEKLSDTRLSRPHSVYVSPSVFFFSFDCKPLFLSNIHLRYSYAQYIALAYNVRSRVCVYIYYKLLRGGKVNRTELDSSREAYRSASPVLGRWRPRRERDPPRGHRRTSSFHGRRSRSG